MKIIKFILAALCIATMSITSCSQNNESVGIANNGKSIVCYFSATGTTEAAAKRIAGMLGCDIHEIIPKSRYTAQDIDWTDTLSRCYVEMHNRDIRPALKESTTDLSAYSVIYIGYPNWWNTHPTIINSFIESNDLNGKTIVPFMTSGGSDITNSEKELKGQYPNLSFGQGLLMNNKSDSEIREWTEQYR